MNKVSKTEQLSAFSREGAGHNSTDSSPTRRSEQRQPLVRGRARHVHHGRLFAVHFRSRSARGYGSNGRAVASADSHRLGLNDSTHALRARGRSAARRANACVVIASGKSRVSVAQGHFVVVWQLVSELELLPVVLAWQVFVPVPPLSTL